MSNYHIGEAIMAEVEKQGLQVSDFAVKINLSRQAVYNIFKSDQISTERLMVISKALGHDFFADLSGHYRGVNVDVLQSLTPTNGNTVRMYENMPLIKFENVQGVIEEFFSAPRTKPLFIFYMYDNDNKITTSIDDACANQLSRGSVNYYSVKDKLDSKNHCISDIDGFKEKMQEALMLPHQVVAIYLRFDKLSRETQLALAAEMAKNTDKWVVILEKQPYKYDSYKLVNEAIIDFAPWKNNAFGFTADSPKIL